MPRIAKNPSGFHIGLWQGKVLRIPGMEGIGWRVVKKVRQTHQTTYRRYRLLLETVPDTHPHPDWKPTRIVEEPSLIRRYLERGWLEIEGES